MEGKKYYVLIAGLIAIGISTVLFYRQQQEARVLEFEGYEITAITEQVDDLYNEEKTDIQRNLSEETFTELKATFLGLLEQGFSGRNEQRIQKMYEEFLTAGEMFKTERDVASLFEAKGIVKENTSLTKVSEVEQAVRIYEDKPVYYERNSKRLDGAKEQIEHIEKVEVLFNSFYDDEGHLLDWVTREEEDGVLALIRRIKNQSVREKWRAESEKLAVALTEAEEAIALEAALEEQRLLEEQAALEEEQRLLDEAAAEEELEEVPEDTWVPPVPNGEQNTGPTQNQPWQPAPPAPNPAPAPPVEDPDLEPTPTPEEEEEEAESDTDLTDEEIKE